MGDHEDVLPAAGLPFQLLVRSNTRRPMTTAATSRYWLRMKSAEAWVVRHSSSVPGKLQVTSPLPYQSNSGPTPSWSSAMNPSRETTAAHDCLAHDLVLSIAIFTATDSTAPASQVLEPVPV
jgi:hypothetical protein